MTERYDNSIESNNLPTQDNIHETLDYATYRCMITEVIYVGQSNNITNNSPNPRVLYSSVILGGKASGSTITNIRCSSLLGGQYNYYERVLRKTSKKLNIDPISTHDGDIVLVQFLQGNRSCPEIISCETNHLDKTQTGATKALGPRLITQFNGIQESIDKDGNYAITRKGGAYDSNKDYFVPKDEAEYKGSITETFQGRIQMTGDGQLLIETYSGKTKILIDGKNDKVVINAERIELGDATLEHIVKDLMLCAWINDHMNQIYNSHTHIDSLGYPTSGPSANFDTVEGKDIASLKHVVE